MTRLGMLLTWANRIWNQTIIIVTATLTFAIGCSTALAQSGAGSIQGGVTDTTGAVIVGASIGVVNQATGVAVDTKSNNVGFYQVPSLFTGTYIVTITAPGMQSYRRVIELLVAQNAVIDATLVPGAVTQQVTVAANAVQLTDTTNGIIGSTLENARINQLPMNGRDLITLTNENTPGLESCGQSPSCANGLMPGATDYVVDGATLESRMYGGASAAGAGTGMPDPDAVQEVRMETSGVGAEYATPAVGVLTTKSGTNQLHGSFFETARNNAWGIAKVRQDPTNFAAPHYVRNEFGASAGGPIVLPYLYHGKDKSFWFFAYERYSLGQTSYDETVTPTSAMRSGDWSGLVNGVGVLTQLYDPNTTASSSNCNGTGVANQWCRVPFANNQIPISRLSPTAKVLYAITPPPTTTADPLIMNNLDAVAPSLNVIPNITFRLDHNFNENNRAYLRYTSSLSHNTYLREAGQPATIAATVNGVNYPANATGIVNNPTYLYATSIGFTHIFSPAFFSETEASMEWVNRSQLAAGSSPHTDVEAELGLPNNFGESGFPEFNNNLDTMEGTLYQYGMSQIISNVTENLTRTAGKHQVQFGGGFRHERFGFLENQVPDIIGFGAYATALEDPSSGANYTGTPYTGYADADEFIGAASSYNVNLEPPYLHFHDMELDAYVQDNYRLNKHLTLNLGLRYEALPALWIKGGAFEGFDFKNDALVLGAPSSTLITEGYVTQAIISNITVDGGKVETPEEAGLPPTLLNNYDFNFLPRAGFAWQPFNKLGTVIRGAYGRYIYPMPIYFAAVNIAAKFPFTVPYTEEYTAASQSPDGLPNYLMRAQQTTGTGFSYSSTSGTPVMGLNTTNVINSGSTNAILPGQDVTNMAPDDAPDMVTQANFTLEQTIKGNSALRVSWVFSHDANLFQHDLYNEHPSKYAWEVQTGIVPPTGGVSAIGTNQYSTTATGPYDKIMWGGSSYTTAKTGWSTDNALQVSYYRLFRRGIAWQINYAWSKPMHISGESNPDGEYYPSADYAKSGVSTVTSPYGTVITPNLGPTLPSTLAPWQYFKAMNRFENYRPDTNFPEQHITFNGIVDLPIGHGKWFLPNANRFVDEVAGGWQIAGDGSIISQDFTITSTHWGPTNSIHMYKHKVPITDCRSGICYKEFEWFNGYLAPTVTQGFSNSDCTANCVTGLPGNWVPYQTPIDTTPGSTYYGDDEVQITLPGGKPAAIAYSPGPQGANPFSKTTLNGPMNWSADASIFKVFPVTERVNLRFNMDAFNVFNVQGEDNPNATDGTMCVTPGGVGCSSYNAARQIQFTMRLTF